MQRGEIRARSASGDYPYESFQIDTSADVFLTLLQLLDAATTPTGVDLSASSTKVYLRAKVRGSTSIPINVEMTKRAGTASNGDTGKVSAVVRPSSDDFDAGDLCVMGAYVVDTATVDTPTVSGYKEILWPQLWGWVAVGKFDGTGL